SDGDIMEGVGCEAASLAGHLKLSNLCWIYDDNRITIEGHTDLSFSENVAKRFEGLGWNTVTVEDANNLQAISGALDTFLKTTDRPTLIVLRSIIGYGSPNKADSHDAHGAPLGEAEIKLTKNFYGWPEDAKFEVPGEVVEDFANGVGQRGRQAYADWKKAFDAYGQQHPQQRTELQQIWSGELPGNWDKDLPVFTTKDKGATRVTGGKVLNAIAKNIPWMLGGSADLAPSTKTLLTFDGAGHFGSADYAGRNFHFGIREHGMAAAANGMALSGLRPYVATFFVFSDYLRPSMRLSSLMRLPVLYVFTHDSIGLGEDGPTHQPVEQLAACRAIPGLIVARPGDANEVAEVYRAVMPLVDRPVAMILTRQDLPTLDRDKYAAAAGAARGGYVLADAPSGKPSVILIGTGSELPICVEAYERLVADGVAA
ncbi:MAG: transketolase, partial [Planctomycetales bacterium]|nr:transketolase [Planctomycetales bacterium]